MIRFLFRLLAMLCLAIAVMYGVIDIARYIADGQWAFTPLGEAASVLLPEALTSLQRDAEAGLLPVLTGPRLATLLNIPTSVLALVLAFLFYLVGRKPRRRKGRFMLE